MPLGLPQLQEGCGDVWAGFSARRDTSFPVWLDRSRLTHLGESSMLKCGTPSMGVASPQGGPREGPFLWSSLRGGPTKDPPSSPRVPKQEALGTTGLQQPPADSQLPSWKGYDRIPGMCLELREKIPKITSINT